VDRAFVTMDCEYFDREKSGLVHEANDLQTLHRVLQVMPVARFIPFTNLHLGLWSVVSIACMAFGQYYAYLVCSYLFQRTSICSRYNYSASVSSMSSYRLSYTVKTFGELGQEVDDEGV
jgi:hypothetical protein